MQNEFGFEHRAAESGYVAKRMFEFLHAFLQDFKG